MHTRFSSAMTSMDAEVWTQGQLEKLGRDALTKRAMNIRDDIGKDNLPPMPRHPEALVSWILEVQEALSRPQSQYQAKSHAEANDAYHEAKLAREAAKQRNQGAGFAPQHAPTPARVASRCDSVQGSNAGEASEAYNDARLACAAAKQRNQGCGGIF